MLRKILLPYLAASALILLSLPGCKGNWPKAEAALAPPPALIPLPRMIRWKAASLSLARVRVSYPAKEDLFPPFLRRTLGNILREGGARVLEGGGGSPTCRLVFQARSLEVPRNAGQAYRLEAAPGEILVQASERRGFFYALQTLRQLIQVEGGRPRVRACAITVWPAFRFRGFMHDVGRNFQSIPFLERQIDILSRYKINLFHMHLTDNPGWRVESRRHPELNKPSSYRPTRHPGKFYTFDELKNFTAFCADRGVMVMPEMDMPGHSQYFKKVFGVPMQTPKGAAILEGEIADWCEVFPGPYFHLGSDEVRIRMKDFIPRMVRAVRSHGKEAVVWRPGGPVPDDKVITQLWSRRPGPLPGVRYFDSRFTYLNHVDPMIAPIRYFFLQACLEPHDTPAALGGILCYWPDTRIAGEEDALKITAFYPALLAWAESTWRGRKDSGRAFWAKLPPKGTPAWARFREFETRLLDHRDRYFKNEPFPCVRQTDLPWRLIGPFDHKGDLSRSFPVEKEIRESYTVDGKVYRWRKDLAWGGTIHIRHFFGFPAWIPGAKEGTVYGLTWVHSDRDRDGWMWINFNTLSLSGGRSGAGNPPLGKWSWMESEVWINGKSVPPPRWNHPGLRGRAGFEVEVTNETYVNRPPARVHFRKGWNQVLVKAPAGKWKGRKNRKWCFTAVPVSWDGKRVSEPEGLYYSAFPGKEGNR